MNAHFSRLTQVAVVIAAGIIGAFAGATLVLLEQQFRSLSEGLLPLSAPGLALLDVMGLTTRTRVGMCLPRLFPMLWANAGAYGLLAICGSAGPLARSRSPAARASFAVALSVLTGIAVLTFAFAAIFAQLGELGLLIGIASFVVCPWMGLLTYRRSAGPDLTGNVSGGCPECGERR